MRRRDDKTMMHVYMYLVLMFEKSSPPQGEVFVVSWSTQHHETTRRQDNATKQDA